VRATDSRPDRPGTDPAPSPAPPPGGAALAVPPPFSKQPELAWLLVWLICVATLVAFPQWQVVPFDVIWISFALLYGYRLLPNRRTLALTATAVATTVAALSDDMIRHLRIMEASVAQIPLLTTICVVMAVQAHRRMVAGDRAKIAAEAHLLLRAQSRFLQDASHQLRTPITIALGHAELLAAELAGQQHRDINVVVGELERLRTLSDRLLLIAASDHPDFLTMEPTDLDVLVVELLRRWRPTAPRHWQVGRLDPVNAVVDAERLAMALDALVENAVKHTGPDDVIRLAVSHDAGDRFAHIFVEDTGDGIADADVPHVFERFSTVARPGSRGTGLGLALVEAIARGHGGQASVRSSLGLGSRFELLIPAAAQPLQVLPAETPGGRGDYATAREAS
jgi:signal transduction histidine kinase